MLKNRDQPEHALFAPRADGTYRRFSGLTGRPMDHDPNRDPPGLLDVNGRLAFGQMPAGQARDAMPELWDKTATKQAQSTGLRDQDAPASGGARKSGPAELLQSPFEPDGGFLSSAVATSDQEEGATGGKAAHAAKLLKLLRDKLSPTDYVEFCQHVANVLENGVAGEVDGAADETEPPTGGPPAFRGMPRRGGGITGDVARREFEREWPQIAKIGVDRMGEQAAPTIRRSPPPARPSSARPSPQLALDRESLAASESNADLAEALASLGRIGRAY